MTREEAIKTLKENYCAMCAYGSQNMDSCDIRSCDNRDAINALEQEPRWIPVTEDVPPKGTICLWCNKQGSVFASEITYRSEFSSRVGKHGYFCNGLENYGDIVAWMPLPQPYKAESEDKE